MQSVEKGRGNRLSVWNDCSASYPHGTAAWGNRRAALGVDRRGNGYIPWRDHEKRACFENPSRHDRQRIIEATPRHSSLLFPARGQVTRPFNGFGASKKSLDKCGVENFTHHDLRRTFATNMARLGVRLEVTEKLLNHVSGSMGGIVGVYQRHEFMDEMRDAIARYEAWLSHILKTAL